MGAPFPSSVSDYLRRDAEARLVSHLHAQYPSIEWQFEPYQPGVQRDVPAAPVRHPRPVES